MEISQSIYQSVFSRAYDVLSNLLFHVVVATLLLFCFQSFDLNIIAIFCLVAFLYFAITTAAIYFFVPSPYRKICFYADRFEFFTYDRKRVVSWGEVSGYKITKVIPCRFVIEIKDRENIVFGLYSFSKTQRKNIVKIIEQNS